jgi:hypothetical protein
MMSGAGWRIVRSQKMISRKVRPGKLAQLENFASFSPCGLASLREISSWFWLIQVRGCYALWPQFMPDFASCSFQFAADDTDSTDLRGFFWIKADFSCKNP